jgi:hypothetical protein
MFSDALIETRSLLSSFNSVPCIGRLSIPVKLSGIKEPRAAFRDESRIRKAV